MNHTAIAITSLCLASAGARAQDYTIPWHTIDAGGGTSSGGGYTLSGTIGQHDAGAQGQAGQQRRGGEGLAGAAVQRGAAHRGRAVEHHHQLAGHHLVGDVEPRVERDRDVARLTPRGGARDEGGRRLVGGHLEAHVEVAIRRRRARQLRAGDPVAATRHVEQVRGRHDLGARAARLGLDDDLHAVGPLVLGGELALERRARRVVSVAGRALVARARHERVEEVVGALGVGEHLRVLEGDLHALRRLYVADALPEQVRAVLHEHARGRLSVVVGRGGDGVARADLGAHHATAAAQLHAGHRGALGHGEEVLGLDGSLVGVLEDLRDLDARDEAVPPTRSVL